MAMNDGSVYVAEKEQRNRDACVLLSGDVIHDIIIRLTAIL